MTARCLKIVLVLFLPVFPARFHAGAQEVNCAGIVQSYSRIGIYYELAAKEGSFMSWSLCAETAEMFSGRTPIPGMSLSFGWNFILSEINSPGGNSIVFFAGPGFTSGISRDYKTPPGFFFGLQGMAGICMHCARNVDISADIAPVIGLHSVVRDEAVFTKYYNYGLMKSFIPEIRIGYRF